MGENKVRGTRSVTVIRTAKCPVSMPSEKRQNMAKRIDVWGACDAIQVFYCEDKSIHTLAIIV